MKSPFKINFHDLQECWDWADEATEAWGPEYELVIVENKHPKYKGQYAIHVLENAKKDGYVLVFRDGRRADTSLPFKIYGRCLDGSMQGPGDWVSTEKEAREKCAYYESFGGHFCYLDPHGEFHLYDFHGNERWLGEHQLH